MTPLKNWGQKMKAFNFKQATLLFLVLVGQYIFAVPLGFSDEKNYADQWIEIVKNGEFKGSLSAYHMMCQTASNKVSANVKMTSNENNDYAAVGRNFQEKYVNQIENDAISAKILKTNNQIIRGTLDLIEVAGVASSGGLGIIGLGMTKYAANEGLNYVEQKFEEASSESARRIIGAYFSEYSKTQGKDIREIEAMIKQNPEWQKPEYSYEQLFGKSPVFNSWFDKVDDKDKAYFNNQLIKVLATDVAKGDLHNLIVDKWQDEQIKNNAYEICKIGQFFNEFRDKTFEELKDINKSQTNINNNLDSLNKLIEKNSQDILTNGKDIEFIHEFMFGKMSPEEQQIALQKGWHTGLQGEEKEKYELKLEILVERRKLTEKVGSYLTGASTIINIAQKVGLGDEQFVKDAANIVSFGESAFNAFASISTGNYFGAAQSIVSALGIGGSKPDVGAERHKQVMRKLEDIQNGIIALAKGQEVIQKQLEVVQNSLRELHKGQEAIINNQKIILESINEVGKLVEKSHNILMDKLEEIHYDVRLNKELILEGLEEEIKVCAAFLESKTDKIYKINNSYQDIINHFNDWQSEFNNCRDGIIKKFARADEFNKIFMLKFRPDEENKANVANYIKTVYEPAQSLLNYNSLLDKTYSEVVSSLFLPTNTMLGLNNKLNQKLEFSQDPFPKNVNLTNIIKEPVASVIVNNYIENFIEIQKYYEFMKTEKELLSEEELFSNNRALNRKGLYYLEKFILPLVEVAIAQQALLSGDVLLPIMEKAFAEKLDKNNEEPFNACIAALKNNKLLARNFMVFYIKNQIQKNPFYNEFSYHFALNAKNNEFLKRIIRVPLEFNFAEDEKKNDKGHIVIPKGWSLKIDNDAFIPLPSALDIAEAKFIYSDEMNKLITLKSKIMDEIVSYTFSNGFSKESKIKLNRLLLNAI